MSEAFSPSAGAALLLQAWRSGEQLLALPGALKPEQLAQGYDLQDALLAATGARRVGWKLGVGSPAAMRAAQLQYPLVGQLGEGRLHRNGVRLRMPSAAAVTIECEIAFVLSRDIAPEAGRLPQPEDIRSTCITFEIVRSRFTDRKTVGWPSFAGDNVGFEALIVGESVGAGLDEALLLDLAQRSVVLLDGEPKARGLFDDTATDPLNSLRGLYAHAAQRGDTLKAGDLVTTGAMCAPFDLPGDAAHRVSMAYGEYTLGFELHP